MKYTLITGNGKVYTFYLLATAKIWQQAYGGQLVSEADVLVDQNFEIGYNNNIA